MHSGDKIKNFQYQLGTDDRLIIIFLSCSSKSNSFLCTNLVCEIVCVLNVVDIQFIGGQIYAICISFSSRKCKTIPYDSYPLVCVSFFYRSALQDWFSRQQLVMLVLVVNIILAILFFRMLTQRFVGLKLNLIRSARCRRHHPHHVYINYYTDLPDAGLCLFYCASSVYSLTSYRFQFDIIVHVKNTRIISDNMHFVRLAVQ